MRRGEKLKHFMKLKGHNTSTLAKVTGVPYTTIRSMIENDLKNSSVDNVIKLCRELDITVDDLLEDDHNNDHDSDLSFKESTTELINKKGSKEYPYFPVAVSAGLPVGVESVTSQITLRVADEILGKHARNSRVYFLRVNGESMNKVFPHNSLIAVKQIEPNELKNGDIVVYSNDYDYAVKRFYNVGDKLVFKPESTEPHFTDYVVDKNDVENLQLHGKVVTYIVNLD